MEKISTVLAALDLQTSSDAVLGRAAQLASAHAARLVVLHVIDAQSLSQAATHMKLSERELQDRLKQQAIAAIESLIVESGRTRRTDVRVEFGSPHEVIADVARERYVDVAVIGPGKGRTLKDKILGSTADRVIRTAAAPILVVKKPSTKLYRNVAVAVDGSQPSARAFIEARRLVPSAAFQLVHAVGIPLTFEQAMLRAGTSQVKMEQYRAMRADNAREELSAFQRDVPGAEKLPIRILEGEPGPALVRFSKGARIDLLALGSHGRGAVLQALLGTVARRVLGEAACDVLVANVQQ
jgi:nucleotide-binding universal stress UspA family protein